MHAFTKNKIKIIIIINDNTHSDQARRRALSTVFVHSCAHPFVLLFHLHFFQLLSTGVFLSSKMNTSAYVMYRKKESVVCSRFSSVHSFLQHGKLHALYIFTHLYTKRHSILHCSKRIHVRTKKMRRRYKIRDNTLNR